MEVYLFYDDLIKTIFDVTKKYISDNSRYDHSSTSSHAKFHAGTEKK